MVPSDYDIPGHRAAPTTVSQTQDSFSPGALGGTQVGPVPQMPWGEKGPHCSCNSEPWPGSFWRMGTGCLQFFPSDAHELVHDAHLALWLRVSPWRVPCCQDLVGQLFISFLKQDCKVKCEKWRGGTQGADGEPGASSPMYTWHLSLSSSCGCSKGYGSTEQSLWSLLTQVSRDA